MLFFEYEPTHELNFFVYKLLMEFSSFEVNSIAMGAQRSKSRDDKRARDIIGESYRFTPAEEEKVLVLSISAYQY